jgi:hypothetical protein
VAGSAIRSAYQRQLPKRARFADRLGKTSVMAIWLVARALAGEDALKAIPRRLAYIVDRRAVVDQATEEAEKLRQAECAPRLTTQKLTDRRR